MDKFFAINNPLFFWWNAVREASGAYLPVSAFGRSDSFNGPLFFQLGNLPFNSLLRDTNDLGYFFGGY